MYSYRNPHSRFNQRTRLPKNTRSPYEARVENPPVWTPGSEVPVVCSKEIINCSRSLCANIGRDLVLPARLFIYSKSGGKLRRKQSERICLNLVLTSSTSSDASTDSSISQCESSQCHEQEREQTGIPNCRPRLSSRRPKSSPCSTTPTSSSRLQRQSLARSPWTSRKDSTHRDTVTKDIFQLPSRSRSSRDNFSALSRCEQSSSSSSSLISESVASRPLDSAVSKNTTDHFSMSSDSTDNVFVRLSRPKLSTVENNQSEAVKQRPLSVVGIELFERLSMPKVLPKPHVLSPSKTRDSKLIDNELFERLAKPKSQTLRRHSEIPQPLKDKFLNSSLETFSGRRSSLQSYRRNSHGLAPVTHQQSSSHVKRHAQTRPINSPIFKTHQLISDTIFEDEDLTCPKKRTTSQSSLDAFDVTREASDLLSTFQYSTDLDDLRLLEEESEDGSEAEVFLSSIDSRISQRSLAEMIQEEQDQAKGNHIPTSAVPNPGSLVLDVEDILKSAEMLLDSQNMEANDKMASEIENQIKRSSSSELISDVAQA